MPVLFRIDKFYVDIMTSNMFLNNYFCNMQLKV